MSCAQLCRLLVFVHRPRRSRPPVHFHAESLFCDHYSLPPLRLQPSLHVVLVGCTFSSALCHAVAAQHLTLVLQAIFKFTRTANVSAYLWVLASGVIVRIFCARSRALALARNVFTGQPLTIRCPCHMPPSSAITMQQSATTRASSARAVRSRRAVSTSSKLIGWSGHPKLQHGLGLVCESLGGVAQR